MGDGQTTVKVLPVRSEEADARHLESYKEGRFDKARTRVHRRGEAHPDAGAAERARKNRSRYMLITPQQ